MNIYAIHDIKAGYFLPMLEASTDEHAERLIADAIRQGNEQLAIHRNDYNLYCLGAYDNKTGEILPQFPPDHVTSLDTLIDKYFTRPPAPELLNGVGPKPEPDATVEELLQEQHSISNDPPVGDDS